MDRNLWIRLGVIVGVVAVSSFLLFPTYRYFHGYHKLTIDDVQKLSDADRRTYQATVEKAMKLGLDLQGGMHVVLEFDESKGKIENKDDAQDRVLEILGTRVDKFGVSEPTMSKQGDNRILLQLPGVDDPKRVRDLIQATAQLEFRMVREPQEVVDVVKRIDDAVKANPGPEASMLPPAAAKPEDAAAVVPPSIGPARSDSAAAVAGRDSLFPDLSPSQPPAQASVDLERPFS